MQHENTKQPYHYTTHRARSTPHLALPCHQFHHTLPWTSRWWQVTGDVQRHSPLKSTCLDGRLGRNAKNGAERTGQISPVFKAEVDIVFEHGSVHEPIRALIIGTSLTPLHKSCSCSIVAGGVQHSKQQNSMSMQRICRRHCVAPHLGVLRPPSGRGEECCGPQQFYCGGSRCQARFVALVGRYPSRTPGKCENLRHIHWFGVQRDFRRV